MSAQDKFQQYVSQLDKEVCLLSYAPSLHPASSPAHCSIMVVVLEYMLLRRLARRLTRLCIYQLSKYPALVNLEKQSSVPKAYAAIGLGALYFFFIIFNLGGQLLTNFAGFIIPGYYSMQALCSMSKTDDTQWLTVSCHALTPDAIPGCLPKAID